MPRFFERIFSGKKQKEEVEIPLSKGELYDVQTERIIKRVCKKSSNCIDIGANVGDVLNIISKYAPDGTHYVFEPIPDLYENLASAYKDTTCKIFELALSDTKGVSSFNYVISNPAYSGLIKRRYDREEEEDTLIQVKTDLLDDVLPKNHPVHLIKIDVEGGELPVMRGAINTIKKWKPVIVFEHGLGSSEFYGTTPEKLYALLNDCGLEVYTLTNWLDKNKPLTINELRQLFDSNEEYYFVAS
ncbi:FkbM family methyltransferase [Niabella pedocola]|uniref:FkbM family methyltransferase n=1 Tax=Niabella pedocola TaxID=1752077 RepID=A0ABS8PYM9_9BACT|nr:FkbM family methyltransferase [Niabella pedocola]MCD2425980.1 FkbM family methyltransferase [Niabella pedocola]